MKAKKIVTAGAIVLTASLFWAQSFDDGDFSFDSIGSDDSSSPVQITGDISADFRYYPDAEKLDTPKDVPVSGGADASLGLDYSGNKVDAELKLNFNSDIIKEHPEDVIGEVSATAFLGDFKLQAGKMNVVWGKGDKLHVIDNFNADDYTDFIIPDYLDRRISTSMLKLSWSPSISGNLLSNVKLEGVYTPFLPTDRFASTGCWVPSQVENLTSAVTNAAQLQLEGRVKALESARLEASTAQALLTLGSSEAQAKLAGIVSNAVNDGKITVSSERVKELMYAGLSQDIAVQTAAAEAYSTYLNTNLTNANTAYLTALNQVTALTGDSGILYPDTNKLEYGQAGARLTFSVGQFDLGASYYYGHYKQPTVNVEKMNDYLFKYMDAQDITDEDKFLAFDQKQTFGIEAATILWHFNLRGEAAYNLTKDTAGDDPWIHNNSIQWLGGFDIDLPICNMNLNIQETGTYILNNDKITGVWEEYDADYSESGKYTNNKIVVNLSSSFQNDKIAPEVTVMYGIERGDLVVMPKLIIRPSETLELTASGMYINCKDSNSEFYSWRNNSFIQFGASMSF